METGKDSVRSVDRALKVLQVFSFENSDLSLACVCEQTGLPKTTVFRILHTLEENDYVIQDTVSGKYRLGYGLIKLGAIAQGSISIGSVAYPYMEEVSKETGQTCNLYIRDGFERVCIEQVMGSQYVKRYSFLGARQPLHCGAGKILLAYASQEYIESFLKNVELVCYTDSTITSKDVLREKLKKIRSDGYTISMGERDAMTAMVALPVYDYTGSVIAAITVSGPISFFTDDVVKKCIGCLKTAAQKISKKLGY